MNNNIILMPEYMKNFNCTSLECKDDCCYGWKVTVDRTTYKKYRNVQKTAVRNELSKYILRNKNSEVLSNYAYIYIYILKKVKVALFNVRTSYAKYIEI